MWVMTLYYIPQYKTTTLATVGGIDNSTTSGIKLQSVDGIDISKPGIVCLSYANPLNIDNAEYVSYTSIDGTNVLVGATRGAEDITAKEHAFGVTCGYVVSKSHINLINDLLTGVTEGIKVKTSIQDVNGNEVIKTPATASAVNEITVTNAATGNDPEISATGGDTDIDLKLKGKGTGFVQVYNPTTSSYRILNVSEDGWIPESGTWTYASADAPTFTLTVNADVTSKIGVGDRIKLTQTTAKYFIVTAISYSAPNTTITIYGGTDYTLANAAITLPYFSHLKSPLGFPMSPAKWSVTASDTARTQAAPGTTVYNLNSTSISIPIGVWQIIFNSGVGADRAAAGVCYSTVSLSTANNSITDPDFNITFDAYDVKYTGTNGARAKTLAVASKTPYYVVAQSNTGSPANLYRAATNVLAICSYL